MPALADPAWSEDECRALAARYGCSQWLGDVAWPGDRVIEADGATEIGLGDCGKRAEQHGGEAREPVGVRGAGDR